MELSKISKKIVAVVSAIALVIASIVYAPATATADEDPTAISTDGGWVNLTADSFDREDLGTGHPEAHQKTTGISGFYTGTWNGYANMLITRSEDPNIVNIDLTNNANEGAEWLVQLAMYASDLDASKVYSVTLTAGDITLLSTTVNKATEYRNIIDVTKVLPTGQYTLALNVEEMTAPTGDVDVQEITITPNEKKLASDRKLDASWNIPEGTAYAYAYLNEVSENNGVNTGGWDFNKQAKQPMNTIDNVVQTNDAKIKFEAGETYTLIVESYNAFGAQNGYGELEFTVPGKSQEEIESESIQTDIKNKILSDKNIAKGKSAYAISSGETPEDVEANVITDGNLGSGYQKKEEVDPKEFYVDLGEVKNITAVATSWEASNAKAYDVMISLDNETYTTVASVSGLPNNKGNNAISEFNQVAGRYVKIKATELSDNGVAYGLKLFELGVFAADDTDVTTAVADETTAAADETTAAADETTAASDVTTEAGGDATTAEAPTEAPEFDPSTLNFREMTSGDVTIGYATKDAVAGINPAYLDNGQTLQVAFLSDLGKATSVTINGAADSPALILSDVGLVKVNPTLMADNAYTVVEATFEGGQKLSFVVKRGAPEEVTTVAPADDTTVAPQDPTDATEAATEAPTDDDDDEFVPFDSDDLIPINSDNFTVTEQTYDKDSGDVNAEWFAVGGYEVFVAYWNNVTASAAVAKDDTDHIGIQQHTSNWWDKWAFQVRKSISGLNPGEEYTMLIDLYANGDEVKYYTSSAPDKEVIKPADEDYDTVEITATANDDGVATFNMAFGYTSPNAVIDLSDPVVYDANDDEVYPGDDEDPTDVTEAPTDVTEAPTDATEAPTDATEAPTDATTVAPTESSTVVPATTAPVKTTVAPAKTTKAPSKVKKPAKVKIKKIAKKKKSAKKIKVTLRKAKNAKGYQVAAFKSKKNAKKNKKALVRKFSKKLKVTLKSKKLKGKKKIFVKARAYNLNGKAKIYGSWSKIKKVKIK